VDERLELAVEALELGMGGDGVQRFVVAGIALVFPDVDYSFSPDAPKEKEKSG
jgi:hypothetical protein